MLVTKDYIAGTLAAVMLLGPLYSAPRNRDSDPTVSAPATNANPLPKTSVGTPPASITDAPPVPVR